MDIEELKKQKEKLLAMDDFSAALLDKHDYIERCRLKRDKRNLEGFNDDRGSRVYD